MVTDASSDEENIDPVLRALSAEEPARKRARIEPMSPKSGEGFWKMFTQWMDAERARLGRDLKADTWKGCVFCDQTISISSYADVFSKSRRLIEFYRADLHAIHDQNPPSIGWIFNLHEEATTSSVPDPVPAASSVVAAAAAPVATPLGARDTNYSSLL